jgi:hypothetical protein
LIQKIDLLATFKAGSDGPAHQSGKSGLFPFLEQYRNWGLEAEVLFDAQASGKLMIIHCAADATIERSI